MAFDKGRALVIGVGTYAHMPDSNVPVTVADATRVKEVLCDRDIAGYLPAKVTLLHDETASREGILGALKALKDAAGKEDTIFLYYCGHGAYGADGHYYLTTSDTRVSGKKVVIGSGISEPELLDSLRAIAAKRMLLVFNACHSGEISPDLDLGSEDAFGDVTPPDTMAEALLSTGEGRIIITASRAAQKSFIGRGKLTIFTQALVDGLCGKGYVPNNHGYIGAFGLYEHVYWAVKEASGALGKVQEPMLTALKQVGPFPVALYRGATDLGTFDAGETVPEEAAAHWGDPARSARLLNQKIRYVTASGARSVAIGGNVSHSNISTGDQKPAAGGEDTAR